ncbi:hypothetical protein FCV25MIE_17839 [Fagus crenata]
MHCLPPFETSSVDLEAYGNSKCFALSTSKELEKLVENRQIQDSVSAGLIGDLQALVTCVRGVGFKRTDPIILCQVRHHAKMASNCYMNIFWSSADR